MLFHVLEEDILFHLILAVNDVFGEDAVLFNKIA